MRGALIAIEIASIELGNQDPDQMAAEPWRLASAYTVSPPRNFWATCRLNSIEWVRCLAMGFLLESPVQLADSQPFTCPLQGNG